jgi:hypothetical protein
MEHVYTKISFSSITFQVVFYTFYCRYILYVDNRKLYLKWILYTIEITVVIAVSFMLPYTISFYSMEYISIWYIESRMPVMETNPKLRFRVIANCPRGILKVSRIT